MTTATLNTTTRINPWGRLTGGMQHPMPAGTSVPDALALAGLTGWDVQAMPLITAGHDGEPIDTGKIATVRRTPEGGSAVLGVGLSAGYPIIQNEVALGMDAIVSQADAAVDFAGGIKGGKQVFLSMRLPDALLVGGEDRTDLYLTALSSHDGSMALTLMVTPVRFVCTNVMKVSRLSAVSTYKVRHVGDAGLRIAEARAALDLTFRYADEWTRAMDDLLAQDMTDRAFDAMVAEVFLPLKDDAKPATITKVESARADLTTLFRSAPTQEFGRGTRYAAFNALTEWAEWVRPANPDAEGSTLSVLDGAGANLRDKAYAVLARR